MKILYTIFLSILLLSNIMHIGSGKIHCRKVMVYIQPTSLIQIQVGLLDHQGQFLKLRMEDLAGKIRILKLILSY